VSEDEHDFTVVFVCTGNRFRSPLAEHLLRAATAGLPVRVSSVGTQELASGSALPEAIELGRGLGVDLTPHRSRPLHRELVEGADLVLGFERRHMRAAVVVGGVARERAFTAGELAALLRVAGVPEASSDPVAGARSAVAEADRLRRQFQREPAAAELADPFGGSDDESRASASAVAELVREIAAALFGRALPG